MSQWELNKLVVDHKGQQLITLGRKIGLGKLYLGVVGIRSFLANSDDYTCI